MSDRTSAVPDTPTPPIVPPDPAHAGYATGVADRPAPPAQRPRTVAIVALALAIVGVVGACIPFVTWFAGALLLAAFVLSLVAIVAKTQGGKGMGIAALVLSVVGWVVSIIMSIASIGMLGQAAVDQAVREDTAATSEDAAAADADEPAADTADARQELVVVESAFGRDDLGSDTWWYVVVIDNPNQDYIFDFAGVDVEALAADGTILDSSSDYTTILSGRIAFSGTFFSVGDGEVTELSVRGPQASSAVRAPLDETGAMTIADITASTDRYSTSVQGTVSGTFEDDQQLVAITVIARDPAGAIIGAQRAFVDRLPAGGGKVQFEATFFDPLPGDTTYEAYASL